MNRALFYSVANVPISDLYLDIKNPRTGNPPDEAACLEKILLKGETFMNILKHIAENGLSIEHILISKNAAGKWVVRNGNRRIAALKLLNDPGRAPFPALGEQIKKIADKYKSTGNILTAIDCIACDDEKAIKTYIQLKHTGENNGVGQQDWQAISQSIFNLDIGIKDQDWRATKLVLWAGANGIDYDDSFPVTTLSRLISGKNLKTIGLSFKNEEPIPLVAPEKALKALSIIIDDISNKRKDMSRGTSDKSLYTTDNQIKYLEEVAIQAGIKVNSDSGGPTDGSANDDQADNTQEQGNGENQAGGGQTQGTSTTSNTRTPRKSSWDRPHVIRTRGPQKHQIRIPPQHRKACNIVVELSKISVRVTPIASCMLVRSLIELSVENYFRANRISPDNKPLSDKINRIASRSFQNNIIDIDQKILLEQRAKDSIISLNKIVHSEHFHPNFQQINTFFDEIEFFINICWQ